MIKQSREHLPPTAITIIDRRLVHFVANTENQIGGITPFLFYFAGYLPNVLGIPKPNDYMLSMCREVKLTKIQKKTSHTWYTEL